MRCFRHVRHIRAVPRRYGGRLQFIRGAVSRLRLNGTIHNLDQIDDLNDARDAVDTFDGDLPQVKCRHPALNHDHTSLNSDFQRPM